MCAMFLFTFHCTSNPPRCTSVSSHFQLQMSQKSGACSCGFMLFSPPTSLSHARLCLRTQPSASHRARGTAPPMMAPPSHGSGRATPILTAAQRSTQGRTRAPRGAAMRSVRSRAGPASPPPALLANPRIRRARVPRHRAGCAPRAG